MTHYYVWISNTGHSKYAKKIMADYPREAAEVFAAEYYPPIDDDSLALMVGPSTNGPWTPYIVYMELTFNAYPE